MTFRADRTELAEITEQAAIGLLTVPVATFVLATAGLAVHIRIHALLLIGVAVALAVTIGLGARTRRIAAWATAIVVTAHVIGLVAALAVSDQSWDGLWYHEEAVVELARGWDPFRQSVMALGTPEHAALWIDHYPKAAWEAATPWFLATGRIDAGKITNFTLLCAAACLVASTLLRRARMTMAMTAWVTALVAANPVAIYQFTTYDPDGLLACLVTVLAAALLNFACENDWRRLAPACLAIVFLTNLKFTGVAYTVVFVAGAAVALAWRGRIRVAARLTACTAFVTIFSVGVLGYAPYVQNTLEHRSPIYPLGGPDAYDITTPDRPVNLTPHNRVMRFVIATFSQTGNRMPPDHTVLKWPWSIDRSELEILESLTGGGLGPLFAAALVLSGIAWLGLVISATRSDSAVVVLAAWSTIAISLFVHSEGWWVRYVPQAWLLVPLTAIGALLAPQRFLRGVGLTILVLLSADDGLVCRGVARAERWRIAASREAIAELRAAPKPVHVYLHAFPGYREKLLEAGIPFVEIPPPAYTSTREDLLERDYMPPDAATPPGLTRYPVRPHSKIWYAK